MNIKEVFEKCNNGDYVIDNFNKKWKVDKEELTKNYFGNLNNLNNFYTLKQITELEFKKVYDIDWSKVDVDTKILVSYDGNVWRRRYFAKYENDKVCAFVGGATSFSNRDSYISWKYAKLYKEEK